MINNNIIMSKSFKFVCSIEHKKSVDEINKLIETSKFFYKINDNEIIGYVIFNKNQRISRLLKYNKDIEYNDRRSNSNYYWTF